VPVALPHDDRYGRYVDHHAESTTGTFVIDSAASALLIEARSTVGPIELATAALTGSAEVALADGRLHGATRATIELAVDSLTSGNALYDAEVHRRLDARRYPVIRAELQGARPLDTHRWALEGGLTIHGTTRDMTGSADVRLVEQDRLRILGEQVLDIRDFAISLPSTLMLRIYPDVMVRFRLEAQREV
jgi:polyisoprenoid-binding protein YceI